MPEVKTLSAMADFFNVTTDYLLGKTNLREHFIAEKLKSIRGERTIEDYSQNLGISSNLLKSFEEGKEIPSKGILDYIAEIEGIDSTYFFNSSKIDESVPAIKTTKIFGNEIENWLKTEESKVYIEFIYKAYKQGISKEMLKKADINIKIT
jgi:transcriptional regulator with XRE-family HTH domain